MSSLIQCLSLTKSVYKLVFIDEVVQRNVRSLLPNIYMVSYRGKIDLCWGFCLRYVWGDLFLLNQCKSYKIPQILACRRLIFWVTLHTPYTIAQFYSLQTKLISTNTVVTALGQMLGVPLAAIHSYAITVPSPCLTDYVVYLGSQWVLIILPFNLSD